MPRNTPRLTETFIAMTQAEIRRAIGGIEDYAATVIPARQLHPGVERKRTRNGVRYKTNDGRLYKVYKNAVRHAEELFDELPVEDLINDAVASFCEMHAQRPPAGDERQELVERAHERAMTHIITPSHGALTIDTLRQSAQRIRRMGNMVTPMIIPHGALLGMDISSVSTSSRSLVCEDPEEQRKDFPSNRR